MRVLLVEKDAARAARIGGLLAHEGCAVTHALNGEAALDLTRTDGSFDLLMADVREAAVPPLLPYLREDRSPPAVLITSLSEQDALEWTGSIHCFGFIIRESNDAVLRSSLRALIRSFSPPGFRELFAHHAAMILLVSPADGSIVQANDAAVRFYGYPRETLLGMTVFDINQLPADEVKRMMAAARQERDAYFVFPHRQAGGEIRSVEVYSSPIEMEGRRFLLSILHDITERRLTQRALKVSEEKFSQAFHRSPDAVTINRLDDGLYIDVNQGFTTILGWEAAEVLGRSSVPGDLGIWARQEDRARLLRILEERGEVRGFEARFRRKDGSLIVGLMSARIIEIDGVKHNLAITRDISERTRMEEELAEQNERLAVTLESIGDGVIATDQDKRVLLINKAAEALTGWEEGSALGRGLAEVFPIADRVTGKPWDDPEAVALAAGLGAAPAHGALLLSRDGREYIVEINGSLIHDMESRAIGTVLIFRDVTLREKMEEKLQTADKLESISLLAGGIAHDFNNILTGVLGNLSLAGLDVPRDSELRQRLEEAERATLRARDLTRQLLTFARGGAPVKRLTRVDRVVREAAVFAARGSTVSCRFEMADDLWAAEVDEGQLGQVIQNMVINAVQAMPSGGGITVSVSNAVVESGGAQPLPPGPYVRIAIRDEGIGIPEKLLKKIFDPYFTTKQAGSGLGLATSYSIVRNHQGHIEVSSAPGEGSTFIIHLPALKNGQVSGEAPETLESSIQGRKVLVMDDEEKVRAIAIQMLKVLGFPATGARDGTAALELYGKARREGTPFDLVILDLTVAGGMGGRETIAGLLALDPDARVVVSSGYSNDPILAHYHEYGFRAVLPKPYMMKDLTRVLREAFEN
jgi:PAS domain S-box-containing protein